MFTSFSTALSALNATSTAIDVVGNNLANLNTTGYKESVVSFHDLVTQSLGAGLGETQVGFGTARPLTMRQFSQGALQASSGLLDAAIQGDGFFVVRDPSTNAQLYTRAGDFQIDKGGNLLTSTGQRVEGWTLANGVLNTSGAVGDIQIPVGQLRQPLATSNFSLGVNLNASAVAGVSTGPTQDNFSTPIQVVDSLGNPLVMTATFTKDPATPLQWNYQITIPGNATTAGVPGTPTALLATPGVLTFDSSGKMVSPVAPGAIPVSVTGLVDSSADMNINFNLFGADGNPTITQFSQPSATSANSQDGVPAAQLVRVGLGDGGEVLAQYSNGTQQVVAQLALASIRNPGSLMAVGQNNYEASAATALPAVGVANTGGRGQIQGGSLESSTVDIAKEFTNLIVLQRAYQANGKVITAGDQLSQDTINLIR
ncbi:MAG: flagellar hook protein FlgE [Candidatus Solibacter sp.]